MNKVNLIESTDVGGGIFGGIGRCFDRVVEMGKEGSPKVLAGLLISGAMGVVEAAGDDKASSHIGVKMAMSGCGILVLGSILFMAGICYCCSVSKEPIEQEGGICARHDGRLMGIGVLMAVIGVVVSLAGFIAVVVGR